MARRSTGIASDEAGVVESPTRCAEDARRHHLDPVGSVKSYTGFILLEVPPPWPPVAAVAVPEVAELLAAPGDAPAPFRLQLIAGPDTAAGERPSRRLIAYQRGPAGGRSYRRAEYDVPHRAMPSVVADLVAGREPDADVAGPAGDVRDVLICTHGSHDVCCGSRGSRLYGDTVAAAGPSSPGDTTVRVWRSSHLGGHRYAPTALSFPDGYYWAYLEPEVLAAVIDRTASGRAAAGIGSTGVNGSGVDGPAWWRSFRGSAANQHPAVQVVEREALARWGWSWLDHQWLGHDVTDLPGGGWHATIRYRTPVGEAGSIGAEVRLGRQVPLVSCGQGGDATVPYDEFGVVGVTAHDLP